MLKILPSFVIVLLLFSLNIEATVYRCIDEKGTIHYQSFACDNNENEKIMEKVQVGGDVVLYKTENKNTQNNQNDTSQFFENNQFKHMSQSEQNRCLSYLKKYDQIIELIKQRCVRNREDNCDLPAEQIEKERYQKDLSITYDDKLEDAQRKSYKPPILQMKEKLIAMNCL